MADNSNDGIFSNITNDNLIKLPSQHVYSYFTTLGKYVYQFQCNGLETENDIKQWVKTLSEQSYVEWRVARTYPNLKGLKCYFKIEYRCQHSTSWYQSTGKRQSKTTKCSASLTIKRIKQSSYDSNIITVIVLNNEHNHAVGTTAKSLKFRDVSEQTREKLRQLFSNGHSPSSAHHTLQSDALMESGNEFYRIAADRKQVPDLKYCYSLFYKEFEKEYGSLAGDDKTNHAKLKCKLDEWCKKSGGSASFELFENDIIIVILTPLMKRVHLKIVQSGELMFLDASGHCDRTNHKIYLLYTHSVAGGLPLGYIVTSSSKQNVFERALREYCLLDNNSNKFFNRGSFVGPENIITDNDLSERNSLKNIWPNTNLLLCTIHVLRAVWRWILESKHNVRDKIDQRTLFFTFKNIMTADSSSNVIKYYDNLKTSEVGKKYPTFCNYINSTWWPIKESWCMCYRNSLLIRGNHTNNYVEYAVRALKDIVLKRTKAYNIVQLIDLIVSRFDKYYYQRLIDFANGRFTISQLKNFLPDSKNVSLDQIVYVQDKTYLIKNNVKEDYIVDMALGLCTCYVGITGGLCKHQCAIILQYEKDYCNLLPNMYCTSIRETLFFIATGKKAPNGWFNELADLPNSVLANNNEQTESSEVPNALFQETDVHNSNPEVQTKERVLSEIAMNNNCDNLKSVFNDIVERVNNNGTSEILQASETFCKNYATFCRKDHSLQSALCTFGKYGGLKKLASATRIGVQPTSISRRKIQLQGKRRLTSGRPCKSLIRDENMHNYSRRLENAPLKRKHCVTSNVYENKL